MPTSATSSPIFSLTPTSPLILRWVVAGTSITDPEVGPSGEINNSPHLDAELASKLLDRGLSDPPTHRESLHLRQTP